MAEHPNAELFRQGYAAFQSGDLDTVASLLERDVVWNAPGRNRYSGPHRGVQDVINMFVQQAQETNGTLKVEVHDVLANDTHAVVLATISAERGGKTLNDRYTHVAHLVDGKMTECWIFDEKPYEFDEFWA
jgi:ketosteroid isomerase-like protein